jgi:uncharacterized protein YndB with AHSA1/START domain
MTDSPAAVVTECDLPDDPKKVWKALTVPELLAAWLPDAVDYEVLASEPDRLLRYRWRGNEFDSVVTFELSATPEGGTHLRVDHRVQADVLPFRSRTAPVACAGSGGSVGGAGDALAMLRWAA